MLRLPEGNSQDQNFTVEAVKSWLGIHDRWLLILDNADDITIIDAFLPSTANGHVLLTTRSRASGLIAQSINVEQMELAEGTLFLLRRAKILVPGASLAQIPVLEKDATEQLVHLLGGLPLALDQAGAYIEETQCNIQGYLNRYKSLGVALLQRRGTLTKDHPESVVKTWTLSFEEIKKSSPNAARVLQFCAFFFPDTIPEELLIQKKSEDDSYILLDSLLSLDNVIECLSAYSLIRRHPETNSFSMHRLVQAILREFMSKEQQQQWIEHMVYTLHQLFPSAYDEPTKWPLCERYILHCQAYLEHIDQLDLIYPEDSYLLFCNASGFLVARGQYTNAEPFVLHMNTFAESIIGPDHPFTALTLCQVAASYVQRGKYVEAEPLYQHALNIREQASPDDPETTYILGESAYFYAIQGKYEEARSLYQRALDICERALGPDHLDTAKSLIGLADLYDTIGKYAEAEPLYQRALNIYDQVLGPDHPDIAKSLIGLADLYDTIGKYAEAEPLYQRALNIYEQVLGPDHPDIASYLVKVATHYEVQRNYIEAEAFYCRALSFREKVLGPDHPYTAQCLNNLALLFWEQGKYAEAEPLYQRALCISEQVLDPNHPHTATYLGNLATTYSDQGKYTEAEPLYQRALNIHEQAFGIDHIETATVLNNLASFYYWQEKYTEAEPLYQRALNIYERVYGSDHPKTITVRKNYMVLLQKLQC